LKLSADDLLFVRSLRSLLAQEKLSSPVSSIPFIDVSQVLLFISTDINEDYWNDEWRWKQKVPASDGDDDAAVANTK